MSKHIPSLVDPTDAQDAATKNYTDTTFSLISEGINVQTGTTYTLILTDADKLITLDNASAIALTVPTNASVAFPVGTRVRLAQKGAGQVTISGGGVTLSNANGLKTALQWAVLVIEKIATDQWIVSGDAAV